jgi:hypothetical protein
LVVPAQQLLDLDVKVVLAIAEEVFVLVTPLRVLVLPLEEQNEECDRGGYAGKILDLCS